MLIALQLVAYPLPARVARRSDRTTPSSVRRPQDVGGRDL